ncbi:MAG TPA: leucyl aminopeptidase family protein [Micromonosporaceae bacterium]
MLSLRVTAGWAAPAVLALPVGPDGRPPATLAGPLPEPAEIAAYLDDVDHRGRPGLIHTLPRPLRTPRKLLLVGVGDGTEANWRAAGAALARAARRDETLTVAIPTGCEPGVVRGVAEGLLLGSYRFRLGADDPDTAPKLREVVLAVDEPGRYADVVRTAEVVAAATHLARDLTNMPSDVKSPAWLAERVEEEVRTAALGGLDVHVRAPTALAEQGFNGILAVGGGSARGPRLVELSWRPDGATTHIVLVGKGITFDTGGLSIKPREGMKLMRKDMGGAAAVLAATLGAARLGLPVAITTLTPLAENMPAGSAFRPGDVVRHFGGTTSEIFNADAEGRVVLADALSYARHRLRPDAIVDLATLTGANAVALGKRTAAMYSENDDLATAIEAAARAAGENVWRMPLVDDYVANFASDVADVGNSAEAGGAGSITAALFLREFVGEYRDRWLHLDMSAPAWSDSADAELTRGATGWGVRTLLRWLEGLPSRAATTAVGV